MKKSNNPDDENDVPEDKTDDVNKDLEDQNLLPNDNDTKLSSEEIEALIPRNL